MKTIYDIEINDSKEVLGGYIYTSGLMTEKQMQRELEKIGREFLKNNPDVSGISYSAWESENDDIANAKKVFVTLRRDGRKINVLAY